MSSGLPPRLLDLQAVERRTSLRRSRIYQLIRAGLFPKPYKIGQLARWRADEIDEWIDRVTGRVA